MNEKTFPTWIIEFRTNMNLTQGQMAEKLYIEKDFLSRVEKGLSQPTAHLLWALRKYMKININKLLDEI